MKRLYRRYFVLLDTEDKGYGLGDGNQPKGYSKVEIKGDRAVLSLNCQNMKRVDEKIERYRIYLVKVKDVKNPISIELGPMEVDDRGSSEAVFEFKAENVRASKISIDNFDAITVVVENNSRMGEVVAPLVGYFQKDKVNWKSAFNKSSPIEKVDFKEQKKEEIPLINEKKTELQEENKNENIQETIVVPKEPEKVVEPVENNEVETTKPISAYSFEEDSEEIFKFKQQNPLNEHQAQINHIQYYIESTLKLYPRVNPFEDNLSGYEWWQIYNNQQTIYRTYMPFIAYLEMMNNPHQHHYPHYYPSDYYRLIYMYQHYLFGICYNEQRSAKYFVYAIPGRKIKEEQPFAGRTGFVYWKPCNESRTEGIGYWILHIDPVTGLVVEPLEKTQI